VDSLTYSRAELLIIYSIVVSCVSMEIPIQQMADTKPEIHKGETENQVFYFISLCMETLILS